MTDPHTQASWLCSLVVSLAASAAFPAVLSVGPDKAYKTVRAGAQAARDGDTVEIDSGIYRQDVATWRASNLTIRGVGAGRAHMIADGVNEGGKGIWVMQGANCIVENIEFSGAAVPDRNGAGIRAETTGTLTIRDCYFHDNEDGILGPDNASADLVVENSTFEHNGFGDGYSHNMYTGRINSFRLQCSYSHLARSGHNVKSRARNNYILYNRIMDEASGNASYEVDLPEGGRSFLIGNLIQKGPKAENSSLIAYAAENTNAGVLEVYVINNTIVNDRPGGGTFLQMRAGTRATVVNNILAGPGTSWSTAGVTVTAGHNFLDQTRNNVARLVDPGNFDYRLMADSPCRDAGSSLQPVGGIQLVPASQYIPDAHCEPRSLLGTIDIGAYEYQAAALDLIFFPHVVTGGGFSTVFSVTNAGSATAVGTLVLLDDGGSTLPARLAQMPSATERGGAVASSFPLSLPPGAVSQIVASASDPNDAVRKGWAKVESTGGSLWGAARFQLEDLGTVLAAVGVLGSQPTESATIAVDNDDALSRFVGFAVANPRSDNVSISLTTLDEQGRVVGSASPPDLNPLGAGKQVARFLHEYLPARSKFRGSMVLRASAGGKFVVVALVQNQGRYTAIPVIP